eukprot:732313_1
MTWTGTIGHPYDNNKEDIALFVLIVICAVSMIVVACACVCYFHNQKKRARAHKTKENVVSIFNVQSGIVPQSTATNDDLRTMDTNMYKDTNTRTVIQSTKGFEVSHGTNGINAEQ